MKKEHSIVLPKGDASRGTGVGLLGGGAAWFSCCLVAYIRRLLFATRLACNVIEERLSRVQRLHHGQRLRLGEERPGEVETANQALTSGGLLLSHADAQPSPSLFARVQA